MKHLKESVLLSAFLISACTAGAQVAEVPTFDFDVSGSGNTDFDIVTPRLAFADDADPARGLGRSLVA